MCGIFLFRLHMSSLLGFHRHHTKSSKLMLITPKDQMERLRRSMDMTIINNIVPVPRADPYHGWIRPTDLSMTSTTTQNADAIYLSLNLRSA
jgi:hypothetical protein